MPPFLSNALAFVFALGVIIFVHELGHLLAAKGFGVRVLTFSLGFGRRLWGFRRGGTDYRVAIIPLGGYVRMGGEDPEEGSGDPSDFLNKPRWQRVLVYLAGPAMNVVLAIVLVAVVFMVGAEVPGAQDIPPVVGSIAEGSPAAEAGLALGDRIVSIDGRKVSKWDEVHFAVTTSPERRLTLEIAREEGLLTLELTPRKVPRYEFGDAGFYAKVLPHVSRVFAGSPAERAGFRPGDEVRGVDGRPIVDHRDFIGYVEASAGREVEVEVLRGETPVRLRVVPEATERGGKIGVELTYSRRYPPLRALAESVKFNWRVAEQTFAVLGKIATGKLAAKSAISGPIEIAAHAGAAARRDYTDLLFLMGLISISIAIINLLPIPVLDGGQITLLFVETALRRDLSLRLKERINQAGFMLIVVLMAVVLYFDLVKNIPSLSGS